MHANITNEMLLVYGGLAFGILWALAKMFGGKKPAVQIPDERQARFRAAKAELEIPQQDADTGEWYNYESKRKPCDPPRSAQLPTIIDPISRKAVKP